MPDAIDAIANADVITVGPGSLYTSLLPPLLVSGVSEAIARSAAVKIMICNLMTEPGETDGMTSRRHVEIISEYSPQLKFDYILVNSKSITPEQADAYIHEGAEQIGVHGSINDATVAGAEIIYRDLLDSGRKVRHDPARLARLVLECSARIKR
jgi:uncharacterized cofD-like protein